LQTTAPLAQQPYPGGRDVISAAFSRRGVPIEAVPLSLASLSDNTIKQYNVSLKLWWEFCNNNGLEPTKSSVPSVIQFLTSEFHRGCAYGTLNSHRSALSLLWPGLGSDDRIKRLLKGAFRLKPSLPKYSNTWDPQVVLDLVSNWYPNKDLSLEMITKKLVILLAICTAHRVQTLSLIKIENISISEDVIQISIPDLIKTSAPGREQPLLYLPYFKDNSSICPALTLKDYILVTQNKRISNHGALLLTYKAPHRAATSQTVSRWIRQVLGAAGVDVSRFGAHSTRHASTSAARAAGVSIEIIRKAAGWTTSSQTFSRFYNRPLEDGNNDTFAKSVCLRRNTSN
jgi:site-specific recombinase XerD